MKESSRSPSGRSSMAGLRAFLRSRCGSVKAAFHALDVHSVGQLTSEDFTRGLQRLGYTEDANAFFRLVDSTGSGLVSLQAFLHSVGAPAAEDESDHLLQSSFNSVSTRSTVRSASEEGWRSERNSTESRLSTLRSRSRDFDLPPPMPAAPPSPAATPARAFTAEQKEMLEAMVKEAMKQEACGYTLKMAAVREDLSEAVDAFQRCMQETRSSLKGLQDGGRDSGAAMELIQNRMDEVAMRQEEMEKSQSSRLAGFREDLNNAVDTFQVFTQEARSSLKQLQDFRRESSVAMEVMQSRVDAARGDAADLETTVRAIRPESEVSMIKLLAFKDEVSQTLDSFQVFMQESKAAVKELQDSRKESQKQEELAQGVQSAGIAKLQEEVAQLSLKAFKEETSTSVMELKEDVDQSLEMLQIFRDETKTSLRQLEDSRKAGDAALEAIQKRVDEALKGDVEPKNEEILERLASLEAEVASSLEALKCSKEQRAETKELAQTVFEFQKELSELSMKAFKQQTSAQLTRLNAFREDGNQTFDSFRLFMQETKASLKQLNAAAEKVDSAKMQEKAPMRLDEMADRVTSLEAAFQHVSAGAKADVEAMVSSSTEKVFTEKCSTVDSSLARLTSESSAHAECLEKVQRRQQAFSEEIVKRLKVIVEKLDIKDRVEFSVFRNHSPMDSARRTLQPQGGSHCLPVGQPVAPPEGISSARSPCMLEGVNSARSPTLLEGMNSARSSSVMRRVNSGGVPAKALNATAPSGSVLLPVQAVAQPSPMPSPPTQGRSLRSPVGSGGMKWFSPQPTARRIETVNSSTRRSSPTR